MVIDEDITITCSYTPHTDMTAKNLPTTNVVSEYVTKHVNDTAAPLKHTHVMTDITDFDADKFIQYGVNVIEEEPAQPNFKENLILESSGVNLVNYFTEYRGAKFVTLVKPTTIEARMSPFSVSYKGESQAVILSANENGDYELIMTDRTNSIRVSSLDPITFEVYPFATNTSDEITISFLGETQTITVTRNTAYNLRRQIPTIGLIIDLIHPVGSIYTSTLPTNPTRLFGGTWERITDKFLWCANDEEAGIIGGGDAIPIDISATGHVYMPEHLGIYAWQRTA